MMGYGISHTVLGLIHTSGHVCFVLIHMLYVVCTEQMEKSLVIDFSNRTAEVVPWI